MKVLSLLFMQGLFIALTYVVQSDGMRTNRINPLTDPVSAQSVVNSMNNTLLVGYVQGNIQHLEAFYAYLTDNSYIDFFANKPQSNCTPDVFLADQLNDYDQLVRRAYKKLMKDTTISDKSSIERLNVTHTHLISLIMSKGIGSLLAKAQYMANALVKGPWQHNFAYQTLMNHTNTHIMQLYIFNASIQGIIKMNKTKIPTHHYDSVMLQAGTLNKTIKDAYRISVITSSVSRTDHKQGNKTI